MQFSAQTEYGIRAMINLAKSSDRRKSLKIIAEEENISLKYLERILNILRKNGLVESYKGTGGGYTLKKPLSMISMADIVIPLEGPIELMKCVGRNCQIENDCSLRNVWNILEEQIGKTLRQIKLKDLIG